VQLGALGIDRWSFGICSLKDYCPWFLERGSDQVNVQPGPFALAFTYRSIRDYSVGQGFSKAAAHRLYTPYVLSSGLP
jgi:hypothetical protein